MAKGNNLARVSSTFAAAGPASPRAAGSTTCIIVSATFRNRSMFSLMNLMASQSVFAAAMRPANGIKNTANLVNAFLMMFDWTH